MSCLLVVLLFIMVDNKLLYTQSPFLNSFNSQKNELDKNNAYAYAYLDQDNSNRISLNELKHRNQYTFQLDSAITRFSDLLTNTIYRFTDSVDYLFFLEYDEQLNAWIPDGFSAYHYQNNLIQRQTYNEWDGIFNNTTEDNPNLIREYEYNEIGQLVRFQDKDEIDIKAGKFSNLEHYYYDSLDRLVHIDKYHWFNGEDTIRHTTDILYKYNQDDQLVESNYIKYEANQSIKTRDSTYIYYLNNGLRDYEYITVWTSGDNLFGIWKKDYYYNPQGEPSEIIFHKKDTPSQNDWVLVGSHIYEYHNYGSIYSITIYAASSNILEKVEYDHDQNTYKSDIQLSRNFNSNYPNDELHNHMLISSIESLPTGSGTTPLYIWREVDYYYSKIDTISSIIEPSENNVFDISPNPTYNNLNIEILGSNRNCDLLITDLQGRQLISHRNYQGNRIDISHLSSGLYLCLVKVGKQSFVEKIIKM